LERVRVNQPGCYFQGTGREGDISGINVRWNSDGPVCRSESAAFSMRIGG